MQYYNISILVSSITILYFIFLSLRLNKSFKNFIKLIERQNQGEIGDKEISGNAKNLFIPSTKDCKNLIEKAIKYHIDYKSYDRNYYKLAYDIEQYEILLARSKIHDIAWDIRLYDPVALEAAIEASEYQQRKDDREKYWDYYASRIIINNQ